MFKSNEKILELLKERLEQRFGDDIISFEMLKDMPVFVIKKQIIIEILEFLYNDEDLQFRFLTTLCGVHYPEAKEQIGIVYHLHSFKNNQRIRIKSFTDEQNPVFPTATNVFSAANWMERETYDFFGIIFKGHPNLKRILNVDEMDYFPMRKEYPLEDATREDKDDKMFGR
ncbi:MAG: NADH-quinone oxidoreductase subunit C [Bacteroidetes bacterium]|nr:NADH-quinone oxidoreductase subunit C [Bacteroidota bacterium]